MRALLVYPVRRDYPPNRGILNKIKYQSDAFTALGFDVDCMCNDTQGVVRNGELASHYVGAGGPMRHLNNHALFYRHILAACRGHKYDLVYIRYLEASPPLLAFLRALKQANPDVRTIIEIATYPFDDEAVGWKGRLRMIGETLFSPFLKRWTDLIVTFVGQTEIYGVPALPIANGIDLRELPLRDARQPRAARLPSEPFRICGVGAIANWHGYDRVIRGIASQDPSEVPAHFDIAGDGPAAAELKRLVGELKLESAVTFHGMLTGAALDELFARSDLGVGWLAIQRKGLPMASPLKHREYIGRGLPFIFTGPDPDFPEGATPFAIAVPADESVIEIDALRTRLDALDAGSARAIQSMRRFAEDHLSWRGKLEPVLRRVGLHPG